MRKAGTRLRITAQLIDVADGYHLWSERYDRELVDVFAVQDEIAAAIAAKLQVTFDKPAAGTRERATPEQVEAYETYIRGRAALVRRLNLLDAVASFERVIALDPRHARAHASLADAYRLIGQFGLMPQDEAMSLATAAVARALEIDPDLAEALSIAAVIAISWENDPDRAIEQWERALELNPSLSEGRVMLAEYGLLVRARRRSARRRRGAAGRTGRSREQHRRRAGCADAIDVGSSRRGTDTRASRGRDG